MALTWRLSSASSRAMSRPSSRTTLVLGPSARARRGPRQPARKRLPRATVRRGTRRAGAGRTRAPAAAAATQPRRATRRAGRRRDRRGDLAEAADSRRSDRWRVHGLRIGCWLQFAAFRPCDHGTQASRPAARRACSASVDARRRLRTSRRSAMHCDGPSCRLLLQLAESGPPSAARWSIPPTAARAAARRRRCSSRACRGFPGPRSSPRASG